MSDFYLNLDKIKKSPSKIALEEVQLIYMYILKHN